MLTANIASGRNTYDASFTSQLANRLFDHLDWAVSGERGAARTRDLKDKALFEKMAKLGIKEEDFLKR